MKPAPILKHRENAREQTAPTNTDMGQGTKNLSIFVILFSARGHKGHRPSRGKKE
jgi:hypothetical protein